MNQAGIVYLLRKTTLTREEIGKLSPAQFQVILQEVMDQENQEAYERATAIAHILAAIYNTVPRKSSKQYKATDFLGPYSKKESKSDLVKSVEAKGLKFPNSELVRGR